MPQISPLSWILLPIIFYYLYWILMTLWNNNNNNHLTSININNQNYWNFSNW